MAKAGPMSRIEKVFETDGEKLNVKGGTAVAALLFLLWFVIVQTNEQKYFVTVVFAVLLVAQSDPGGAIGKRVEGMSAFAALGALVTAFGFYVGDKAWGFVVLAVFAVTLACGLAVKLGVHRFAAGLLLNVWFLVVLSLATHDTGHLKISVWDQALAWLIGAAAWIALDGPRLGGKSGQMAARTRHGSPGEPKSGAADPTRRSLRVDTIPRSGRLRRHRLRRALAQC